MRLSARQDIEAPIDEVYAAFSDLECWERDALRRGADVTRTKGTASDKPAWIISFPYRGKLRVVTVRLTAAEQPTLLGFAGEGQMYVGSADITLIDLGPRRTRVHLVTEVKPRTITARLMLQAMRMRRTSVADLMKQRLGMVGATIEARYKSTRRP
jgi:hypothetical protein